jgi:hypothetical protein
VYGSSPRHWVAFFHNLLLIRLYVELKVAKTCGIPVSHVLSSRKPDPWEQRVIQHDQDVHVLVYGGWRMHSFWHDFPFSPFFDNFETWAMFLYSPFFMHALEHVFSNIFGEG